MAEGKKAFILYCDLLHTVDKLTDEQAGDLFKHILKYVNDQHPQPNNFITEIAFEPVKQQLKRDLKQYEQKQAQRIEAGKRSAELREAQRKATTVESRSTPSTVIVTDTAIGTGNVTDTVLHKCNEGEEKIPALEIEIKTNLINQNIIPITELENYMISQEVWVSDLARIHKLSPDYETATKKSKEFIHLFVEHLRASNEKGWDKSDCFRYCNNWIKIQLAQKQTKTSKKSNITNLTGKEIYEQF